MAETNDHDEWSQLNQTDWRGLGLTDPIKNVEVCFVCLCLSCARKDYL